MAASGRVSCGPVTLMCAGVSDAPYKEGEAQGLYMFPMLSCCESTGRSAGVDDGAPSTRVISREGFASCIGKASTPVEDSSSDRDEPVPMVGAFFLTAAAPFDIS